MLIVGKLHIIDYEYGTHSYRGYDIANYFNEHAGFDCDYSLYVPSVGCFPICCGSSWAAEIPSSSSLPFKDMITPSVFHTSKLEYVHDSLLVWRICNNNQIVLQKRLMLSAILRKPWSQTLVWICRYPDKEKQFYFFRHYLHPENPELVSLMGHFLEMLSLIGKMSVQTHKYKQQLESLTFLTSHEHA